MISFSSNVFVYLNQYGKCKVTNVTVASSESLLAFTLVLIGLLVFARPAVFAGLMGAAVVQIWGR